MVREITSTTGKYESAPLPEGRRAFVVASAPEKKYGKNSGAEYFQWKFQYEGGLGDQILLPNMMGGLLKALGCTETGPGVYDWDTSEVEGKAVIATVTISPDKKDPTKMRQRMSDFAKPDDSAIGF
jgi:hypothetical protein